MIGKLHGTFDGTTPDGAALINVGGVGYEVRVPLETLTRMRAGQGGTASLFVHTAVREDSIDLYGFATGDELLFFKQLMSVSGIGPKSALGILNVADVATLKRGIAQGEASMLTRVYGIGKKSAERIVVELRDKLAHESKVRGEPVGTSEDGEVIEALMALGYKADEARQALKEVGKGKNGTKERLAAALKYLGS